MESQSWTIVNNKKLYLHGTSLPGTNTQLIILLIFTIFFQDRDKKDIIILISQMKNLRPR